MFPNRRLSLSLMLLVCSSTALASAYAIDRPDSTLQLSSPYSPPFFGVFISNLAGHWRLGNDQVTARSSELVFDSASLADFSIRNSDAWERALTATYDLRLSQASGKLPTVMLQRPQAALVVDEFPCVGCPSPHSLSTLFRLNPLTPDGIQLPTRREAFSEKTK